MKRPRWLSKSVVLAIHGELLVEHGGPGGVRDEGALESALARPRNALAYGSAGLAELAAAYGFGLARNHSFVDGNKRVALAAMDVFLQLNGHELAVTEPEAVVVIRDLAAGRLTETALAAWVARGMVEVRSDLEAAGGPSPPDNDNP